MYIEQTSRNVVAQRQEKKKQKKLFGPVWYRGQETALQTARRKSSLFYLGETKRGTDAQREDVGE